MKELLNKQLNLKLLGIIALALMGVIGLIILIAMLVNSQSPTKINADAISIYISPEETTLSNTKDTNLGLYIDTGANQVASVNIFLSYDPAVISITPTQGEIFALFDTNKTGGIYEIQAGGTNSGGTIVPYSGTHGLIANLKVRYLSTTSTTAKIAITASSKISGIDEKLIPISSQSVRNYNYVLAVATTPVTIDFSPQTASITQTDSVIDINLDTKNQYIQGLSLLIQYDPTQISLQPIVGQISTFASGVFRSQQNANVLKIDMSVDINNKDGFNGSGVVGRLKMHALNGNSGTASLLILQDSQFALTANQWDPIATTSLKTYTYQLNPTVSQASSNISSSKSSISSSKSSSGTSFSKIASKNATGGTMPSTGIFDDGQGFLIIIFVVLSIIGIIGTYRYTKFGSFERRFTS